MEGHVFPTQGDIEPEDQQALYRIRRQREAKNKGRAFQMPPLHRALVNVHEQLANTIRVAKDMAQVSKRTMKVADLMEWSKSTQAKTQLAEWLQQANSKLKDAEEQLQTYDHAIVLVPDKRLWEELQQKEDLLDKANKKLEIVDAKVH